MAILTINVYSPRSGTRFCPFDHLTCPNGSDPIDIMGTGNLVFRATNVKSFSVYRSLCGGSDCNTELRTLMQINLFGRQNQECFIGSVRYLHIKNPIYANGHAQNYNGESLKIGEVPTDSCSTYNGYHSHMERFRGQLVAPGCNQSLSLNTLVYRFTWDDSTCSNISSINFNDEEANHE